MQNTVINRHIQHRFVTPIAVSSHVSCLSPQRSNDLGRGPVSDIKAYASKTKQRLQYRGALNMSSSHAVTHTRRHRFIEVGLRPHRSWASSISRVCLTRPRCDTPDSRPHTCSAGRHRPAYQTLFPPFALTFHGRWGYPPTPTEPEKLRPESASTVPERSRQSGGVHIQPTIDGIDRSRNLFFAALG